MRKLSFRRSLISLSSSFFTRRASSFASSRASRLFRLYLVPCVVDEFPGAFLRRL